MIPLLEKNKAVVFGLIFAVTAYVIIYWHRLLLLAWVPLHGDTLVFHYPSWMIGKSLLKEGFYFLWDPYRNMGQPFLASPQNQALYPLRFLALFQDYVAYQQTTIIIHTLLSAGFGYALFLHWHKDHYAALLGAIGIGFNGFFLSRAGYPSDFMTMAWMPAAVYFLVTNRPILLGFALALAWLAGFPPFFLLMLVFLIIYSAISESRRTFFRCLFWGCLVGGGLSAMQGIPFLELLLQSDRGVFLDKSQLTLNSLEPGFAWPHLLYPSFLLRPFVWMDFSMMRFYDGPVLLALSLWGFYRGSPSVKKIAAIGAVSFALAFGKNLGFYGSIPFISVFQFPARWLLLHVFCLVAVASYGISTIESVKWKRIIVILCAVDLLSFALPAWGLWADKIFLENNPRRLQGLEAVDMTSRVFHSDDLLVKNKWKWMEPDLWFFAKGVLVPSYGTTLGFKEAKSHSGLMNKRIHEFHNRLAREGVRSPLFDYAGISRIVALTQEGSEKELPTMEDAGVYINPDPKGRAFMAGNHSSVDVLEDKPGSIRLSAVGPGQLVLSESFLAGWKVWVNDKPQEVEIFENQFLACELIEGKNTVHFLYDPWTFKAGAAITILTLLLLALWRMWRGCRTRIRT